MKKYIIVLAIIFISVGLYFVSFLGDGEIDSSDETYGGIGVVLEIFGLVLIWKFFRSEKTT